MASSNKNSNIQVLHVDDTPALLEKSKKILTDIDGVFVIDHASCVDEAFKKFEMQTYDVIISDYEMPQKNGLEFLKELQEKKMDIPFILFTDKARKDIAVKALNLGAECCLSKNGSSKDVYGELANAINKTVESKKSAQLLANSEKKYRKLVEESLQGILIILHAQFRLVYANEAIAKILGYSIRELMLLSPKEIKGLIYEEDRTAYFSHMNRRSLDETPESRYEFRAVRKDGSIIWVEALSNMVEYEGQPAIQGIFLNIDERKKAEDKLRESQHLIQKILDCSPNLIYLYDLIENCNVYANKETLSFLGYTPEEVKSMGSKLFANILHPDDIQVVKKHHALFVDAPDNATYDVEYRMKCAGGEWRWLRSRDTLFARTQDGLGKQILGICEDITERKNSEEAIKESEKRSRAIVAYAPIGIAASGADKHFLSANKAFCKILGYTEKELRKLTFKNITHPEDLEESFRKMCKLEEGKISSFTLEKRYVKKDGTIIYGKIMVSTVRNSDGQPSLFIAELEDVTEQKKAEERRKVLERKVNDYSKHLKNMVDLKTSQLKDANDRIVKSERLVAIGELAGMVGHDLRNPLTCIKNSIYYLKIKGDSCTESQTKEILGIIDKAIDNSNKIINDLLDYSKDINLELRETEISVLLNEAIQVLNVPDRIQIVNHVLGETWFRVDDSKMMRIFINLIKNAIDAMPEQGTLEITSRQTKGTVEINFSDTGIGIPDEILPKIFSPLFTTKAQGMGFGLAICKRIIESHKGTITVKTAMNKGTTFTINLPIKPKIKIEREKTWINKKKSLLSTTKKA